MDEQHLSSPPCSKSGDLQYGSLHHQRADTVNQYPQGAGYCSLGYGHRRFPQHTSPTLGQRPQNSRNMTTQVSGPLQRVGNYHEELRGITQEDAPRQLEDFDVKLPPAPSNDSKGSNSGQGTFSQFRNDPNGEGYSGQFDSHRSISSVGHFQSQDHGLLGLPTSEHKEFGNNSYLDSPPTPTSSVQSLETRRTRSGRQIRTKGTQDTTRANGTRVGRSPKTKKASKQGKGEKPKVPRLTAPLSELTKEFKHIPLRNMEVWVNRPIEARKQEVEKRNGYVTRPMNSFMLYRSAFAERTKLWCLQNNHQVVSSVSGASWPLEPSSVRERYNELAKIERINHQNAHPGYKFSPSKAQNNKRKLSDDGSEPSDLEDPDEDYGKSLETRAKRKKTSKQGKKPGKNAGYPANSTFGLGGRYLDIGNGLNKSSYQATNPGKPLPAAMDTIGLYTHYYRPTFRQNAPSPGIEDPAMRKTEAPGIHYAGTPPAIGLPGGNEYDLLHMSFASGSSPLDTIKVDPSLLEYDSQHSVPAAEDQFSEESMTSLGSSFLGNMSDSQFASPYAVENLQSEDLQDYLSAHSRIESHQVHGHQLEQKHLEFSLFPVNDDQRENWHMNEDAEELDPGREYEDWVDETVRNE